MSHKFKMFIVCLLYFAEGAPYGFVYGTLSIYFRSFGMDLREIGVLSLVGLAWTLKVFWSPLVDRFGKRYQWIVPSQIVIIAAILTLALLENMITSTLLWPIIIVMCLASATQDIAIDAYTIDLLNTEEYGIASGYRTGAYRLAMLASGGGIVAASQFLGWSAAFITIAILLAAITASMLIFPSFKIPHVHSTAPFSLIETWKTWANPVKSIIRLPYIWVIVLYVLTYKLGDALMASMVSPFWVDKGLSRVEMGFLSTVSGVALTIVGAMVGGWFTSRYGIMKGLIFLGGFQAISNLGYAAAAIPYYNSHIGVYLASGFESFSSGLGSASFMAFMMRLCKKEFSASQYAIFSALFGLTRSVAGFIGGFGAKSWGYAPFFAFTFFMAIPAFALLPWMNRVLKFRDTEVD